MSTIDDIQFDRHTYKYAINWALLLYQLDGISAVIPLPNANLMSFIRVFNNTIECQNHININPRKMITLFAYNENMERWLADNTNIPNNLKCMKIFCHSDNCSYVSDWAGSHTEKLRNTTFDIITFEELNHELLSFGYKYLRALRKQFRDDYGILNLLDSDYKNILTSLGNHASQRANIENERIRQSQEAQS
jgi:hypothetical protein